MKVASLIALMQSFEITTGKRPARIDITSDDLRGLHDSILSADDFGMYREFDAEKVTRTLPPGAVMVFMGVPVFKAERTRLL